MTGKFLADGALIPLTGCSTNSDMMKGIMDTGLNLRHKNNFKI